MNSVVRECLTLTRIAVIIWKNEVKNQEITSAVKDMTNCNCPDLLAKIQMFQPLGRQHWSTSKSLIEFL